MIPPLVLSFTQAHLCKTLFCNVSRDNCAIPHKNKHEIVLRYYRYKYHMRYEKYCCWASKVAGWKESSPDGKRLLVFFCPCNAHNAYLDWLGGELLLEGRGLVFEGKRRAKSYTPKGLPRVCGGPLHSCWCIDLGLLCLKKVSWFLPCVTHSRCGLC